VQKWLVGRPLVYWNVGSNWPRWNEIADFRSLIARSDSAVTPSGNSSINTNRKSTTRFPMSQRWTSYVVVQKRKVSKIWTISCDNSETVRDRMSVIINPYVYLVKLIYFIFFLWCYRLWWNKDEYNRKSHTGIRLVPTSMTLNDFERRNSPYFAFFAEFDRFWGRLYHSGWR